MLLLYEKNYLAAIIALIGLGLILFSNFGIGINNGNILVGAFLIIVGVTLVVYPGKEIPSNNPELVPEPSKEKKPLDGDYLAILKEVFMQKIKDEIDKVI